MAVGVNTWSEEEMGKKWDRCLTDSVFKIGRGWPILLGAGFGLGVAYANCERDLNATVSHGATRKLAA
ncbi:MICOS complex subunit MIC10 [Gryllus bimaculatus]|nr:MICOS complex subunit MIC10 [Gryllus bimaculatus]